MVSRDSEKAFLLVGSSWLNVTEVDLMTVMDLSAWSTLLTPVFWVFLVKGPGVSPRVDL